MEAMAGTVPGRRTDSTQSDDSIACMRRMMVLPSEADTGPDERVTSAVRKPRSMMIDG